MFKLKNTILLNKKIWYTSAHNISDKDLLVDKRSLGYKDIYLSEKIYFFFSVFVFAVCIGLVLHPFFATADVDSLETLSLNKNALYGANDVAIVVDGSMNPHVFSAHNNTGVTVCASEERYVHAYKESGVWNYECIDADDSSYQQNGVAAVYLESGTSQIIYIAYASNFTAGGWTLKKKVKTLSDESWGDVVWEDLDFFEEDTTYKLTSLDLTTDANGKLAMVFIMGLQGSAYFYYDSDGDEDFEVSEKQTIQSSFSSVINGVNNSIHLKLRPGTTNNFGVVYGSGRGSREDNIYFEEFDGDWSNTLKDICDESASQCFSPSFDYDSSGNAIVAYGSLSANVIRYTRKYTRGTDSWSASTQVGTYSNDNIWADSDLEITSNDVVHYAFGYYESFASTGRYTTSTNGLTGWSTFQNISSINKAIDLYPRGNTIHIAGDSGSTVYYSTNDPGNTVPVATTPASVSQATNGTGYITFQTAISDVDNHNTRLKVEYSDDGGTSWYDPDLISVTPSAGSVSLSDAQTYQIGATDLIDSSGGAVTLTVVWDTKSVSNGNGSLDNVDESDIQVRVTPNDTIGDGIAQASVSFEVDNLDPSQPGNLVAGAVTESTGEVVFGAQSTDANFSEYKIFFSLATPVTIVDNEFSKSTSPGDTDLDDVAFGGTLSTTLSGLVADTQYYANIWAYDNFGNSSVAAAEATLTTSAGTSPPSATVPGTISQAVNGSGYITFQTTITDADTQDTKLKVEYSDDGGTTWFDPDLISVTPSAGTVDLDDAQTYQIGTVDAVDSSTGAVTLTIVWGTKSAGNGNGSLDTTDQTDLKVRVTPNDGTVDGNSVASTLFEVDNLDPSQPGNLTLQTANTTAATLNFGGAVVEAHFSEYKIFYKVGASGVAESDTAFTSANDSDLGTINYGGTSNTTVSILTINTQYVTNIWAYDSFGNSSSGATELAFYTGVDTPGIPTVSADSVSVLTVEIDPATNPSDVTYYICTTEDGTSCSDNGYVQANGSLGASAIWQTYATWGGASGISVTGLSTNTAYRFLVKARNGGNVETGFSTANTAVSTLATTPGTPVVTAVNTASLNVIVDQATNSSVTGYAICRTTDTTSCASGGYVQADGSLGASAAWQTHAEWDGASGINVVGLSQNTSYQFIVKARNGNNIETAFSSASAGLYTLSSIPTGVSASVGGSDRITVSWAGNGFEYYVEDENTNTRNSGWTTATSYQFSSLTAVTQYTFHVKARNVDEEETTWSSSVSATTQAQGGGGAPAPPAPPVPPPLPPEPDQCTLPNPPEWCDVIPNPSGLILINNGDLFTRNPNVSLKFDTEFTDQYVVSPTDNFDGLSFLPIVQSVPFVLPGQEDGEKYVYARFRNEHGMYDAYDVIMLDRTPPVITLTGPSTVYAELGDEYEDLGAQAIDAMASNVPVVIDSSRVNIDRVGIYIVSYVSTDPAGNSQTAIREVIVREPSEEDVTMIVNRGNLYYNFHRISIFLSSEVVDMVKYKSAPSLEALDTISYTTIPASNPQNKRLYEIIHEVERREGEHTIFVKVETASGEEHVLNGRIILDFTPPREPVITQFEYPWIYGTVEPLEKVRLLWGRRPRTAFINTLYLAASLPPGFIPLGQRITTANESGNWEFAFPILAVGEYIVGLRSQDAVGNMSTYVTRDLIVEDELDSICGNTIIEGEEACDGSAPQGFICTQNCTLTPVRPDDPFTPGEDPEGTEPTSGNTTPTGSDNTQTSEDTTVEQQNTNQVIQNFIDIFDSVQTNTGTPAVVLKVVENAVITVQKAINNPRVESANESIAVPVLTSAAVVNVATAGFGATQVVTVARSFFGQIFLLFRRRKQKKWGMVYNGFTKRPIDLAIVRLINAKKNEVVQTQVTDSKGRYFLTTNPGTYRIEVTKEGFDGFSKHLHTADEDTSYTQLYHGESFTLSEERTDIHFAVPLDPMGTERPATQIIRDIAQKKIRFVISIAGFVAAIISLIISPTWWIMLLLLLHGFIYLVFYKLAYHKLPDSFGKVLSLFEKKPLGKVVVRVFDAAYNKLVDTTVSDHKGRYAILVGPSTYYVTYEKPNYEKKKSPILDFSSARTHGEGGIINRDEVLNKEKNTTPREKNDESDEEEQVQVEEETIVK